MTPRYPRSTDSILHSSSISSSIYSCSSSLSLSSFGDYLWRLLPMGEEKMAS